MGECANISITRAPRRRCEQRSSFPASNSDHHCHESGNSFPAVKLNCRKHIPAAQAGRGNARRQIFESGASKRKFEARGQGDRSEEHTSELQSLMRISYAVFCLKKKILHYPT